MSKMNEKIYPHNKIIVKKPEDIIAYDYVPPAAQQLFNFIVALAINSKQNIIKLKIADYFGVTIDYIMTGEEKRSSASELSARNERDIERDLKDTLGKLDSQDGLMFDGEALDDDTRELLRISIENAIRTAKIASKKKFTPKKYKE